MATKRPILACITLGLTLGAATFQPPQIRVKDPRLLYALALYKSAMGDTGSALRLMQRAEQVKQKAAMSAEQTQGERKASADSCIRPLRG